MTFVAFPHWSSPGSCSQTELGEFEALVRKGGEVNGNGLSQRIIRAKRLVFLRQDSALIGVVGLKNPDENYRNGVSDRAGIELSSQDFPIELGWVFVEEAFRGNRLSRRLVACALEAIDGGVFATSRSDNSAMHKTLMALGFECAGNEYASYNGQYKLKLFLRGGLHPG